MNKSNLFISLVVAFSLVFTVSCVSKEVPVTETYYETEYKTESYIEVGEEQREDLTPKWTRYADVYYPTLVEWSELGAGTYYDGYEISTAKLSKSQVKLILSNLSQSSLWGILVFNITGVGQLPTPPPRDQLKEKTVYEEGVKKIIAEPEFQEWLDNLNAITTDPKRSLAFVRSDKHIGQEIVVDVTGVEEFVIIICAPWGAAPVIKKVQLIWSEEVTKERQVPYQHVAKQRTVMQTKKVPFWEDFFGE